MTQALRWLVLVMMVVSSVPMAAGPGQSPSSEAAVSSVLTSQAVGENTLVEALVGEIRKLNPLLATYNPVDQDITSLIFEGVTTSNQYGEIIPALAESWVVSPDGLEYIFTLRDDVLWQDGVPFTATDVVFTFQLMADPLFPGATALHEFWRTVEVDQLDEHTVSFRLTQPLAAFPDMLRMGIVPAHVLQHVPVDQLGQHPFNLSPIGTGPYQIETLTASNGQIDGIQLRVAPVYRQRPEGETGYALDRIVFRTYPAVEVALNAYRLGEVNSIGYVPASLQEAALHIPGLSLYTTLEPAVGTLIYNWERVEAAQNPRARRALAHAVDRDGLVTRHLAGYAIPADSPLVPNSWAYVPDMPWPSYDPAAAQNLLETADLSAADSAAEPDPADGGDNAPSETADAGADTTPEDDEMTGTADSLTPPSSPYEFTILTPNNPALIELGNEIAGAWSPLGFTVMVEVADAATLRSRLETGNFDAALVELSFAPHADPDPYVFWHQGQVGIGQNFGAMNDLRISEALEQARRETLGINRALLYEQFQHLFAERAAALVLYYPVYVYGVDARLQGVQLGYLSRPSDRFRTIREWTFADPRQDLTLGA